MNLCSLLGHSTLISLLWVLISPSFISISSPGLLGLRFSNFAIISEMVSYVNVWLPVIPWTLSNLTDYFF